MNRSSILGLIVASLATLYAQNINLHGRVSNSAGQPVANAMVKLIHQGISDTTRSDGSYSIIKSSVAVRPISLPLTENMRINKDILEFTVSQRSPVKIEIFDLKGKTQKKELITNAEPGAYHFNIAPQSHHSQMLIVKASIGPIIKTFRYSPLQKNTSEGSFANANSESISRMLAKITDAVDTLNVSAIGYSSKRIELSSYDTTVNVTLDATGGVPKVTPQNATSIPSWYGNAVTNPGKLTTNVTYSAYYWSTSLSSPLPPPNVPKQTTPKTKSCNVYTPPGYDLQIQYPLIIIMHGITDNPNTWNERANPKIATLFDNLITSKATKPFIAVFASGTVDNNTNGYYAFGAELTNDLLPFIESKYSVRKDRGSRAMAGFSFGGMQTLSTGLCTHLKEFAWFAGLHSAGPGTPSSSDIAKYVAAQNPQTYPLYYLYIGVGAEDGMAKGSSWNAANGLTTKSPYVTSANFSYQDNIKGGAASGYHDYPTAEVSLYNFLRMAFSPNY